MKLCKWKFKSSECGYSGSSNICDKTIDGCINKYNAHNFNDYVTQVKPPITSIKGKIIMNNEEIGIGNMSFDGIKELKPDKTFVKAGIAGRNLRQAFIKAQAAAQNFSLAVNGQIKITAEFNISPSDIERLKQYFDTEGGGEMNMRKALEHTRMRFNTMTERQLWNRMGKTSVLTKLEAFAQVAEERGYPDMAVAARARLSRMSNGGAIGRPVFGTLEDIGFVEVEMKEKNTVLKTTKKEKLLRKMDTG